VLGGSTYNIADYSGTTDDALTANATAVAMTGDQMGVKMFAAISTADKNADVYTILNESGAEVGDGVLWPVKAYIRIGTESTPITATSGEVVKWSARHVWGVKE
jgi:hypothetical protein